MVNELSVEVKKHGALFEAYLLDLEDEEGSYLKVALKSPNKQREIVSAADVKLPPSEGSKLFVEGQQVEVEKHDIHGIGWWPATSSNTRTCLIRFDNSDESETISWDKIRWMNTRPAIYDLCKLIICVPEKFKDLTSSPEMRQRFRSCIQAPLCYYVPELNAFKIICFLKSRSKLSIADDIRDSLINLCNAIKSGDQTPRKLNSDHSNDTDYGIFEYITDEKTSQKYKEQFTIPQHLTGLALGPHFSNVKRVQTLDGISNVYYNKVKRTFLIRGRSKTAVEIARNLLEYTESKIQISNEFACILQKGEGKILQEIIYDSGLVRIEVEDDENKPNRDESTFVLTGIKGAVSAAQYRIKNELACLKKIMEVTRNIPIPVKREPPKSPFNRTVTVSKALVGLALGRKGCNIERAKNIPGIDRIDERDEDDSSSFTIFGQTEEAISEVVQILWIVEDSSFMVERRLAGKLIGRNGCNIKKITSNSGVIRVDVEEKDVPGSTKNVCVKLLGHPDDIKKAKSFITQTLR